MPTKMLFYILAFVLSGCRSFGAIQDPSLATSSKVSEAPDLDNNPRWWNESTMVYNDLTEVYTLPKIPWAGSYWPTYRGGISDRWRQPNSSTNYRDFLYNIPTAAQLTNFSEQDINALSPAEKYDLWVGRTELNQMTSATGQQRAFMLKSAAYNNDTLGIDEIPSWTGICNGWSLAALHESYPIHAVKVKDPVGRTITFYAADIQALISQIYFDYQPGIQVARLGSLCSESSPDIDAAGRQTNPHCRDINPMSFHIALGRHLAKNKPFVFDIEPTSITLNQPAYGYVLTFSNKRSVPSQYAHVSAGATALVDVKAIVLYTSETGSAEIGWTEQEMTGLIKKVYYNYTLELNANDEIVGGEWASGSKIPDFLWFPKELPTDAILKRINPDYPLSFDKVKSLVALSK